ncbi:HNH endonuclease domain-containing protein, partial [Treponema pedis]
KKISFTDLFGSMPQFDFEHTVPRSLSFDDSLENLTLCDVHFNRSVKKQQLPSQLAGKEDIIKRIKGYYGEKIDQCRAAIERNKPRGAYIEPSRKDAMIVNRHMA